MSILQGALRLWLPPHSSSTIGEYVCGVRLLTPPTYMAAHRWLVPLAYCHQDHMGTVWLGGTGGWSWVLGITEHASATSP